MYLVLKTSTTIFSLDRGVGTCAYQMGIYLIQVNHGLVEDHVHTRVFMWVIAISGNTKL